jgi:DNA-binding transcriptional LysR family regulator
VAVNLHRLTVYCTGVETGSLAAAGRQLVLSPSAVSMRLRALEDEVGQRLLQRKNHAATVSW